MIWHRHRSGMTWVALVTLSLGGLAACGLPTDGVAHPIASDAVPYPAMRPSVTLGPVTPRPSEANAPQVWFVGTDGALVAMPAAVSPDRPSKEAVAAITILLAGPDNTQRAQGRSTAISPGTTLKVVSLQSGTLDIEWQVTTEGGTSRRLPVAIGQIVLTLSSIPEVDRIRFLRDGVVVDVPSPDGELISRPVTAADYKDLTRPSKLVPTTPALPAAPAPAASG